ncbi:uncharacterized protein LOC131060387 isoform X1 [Cryptomeria japonica]|uniref:uncharacterized protein LOC131060387 isoform X1 n=1 Tax=Cryptomeria japonica TaxID=3369 RepID=UPI0025ABA81B|nr:uncharacterized protein LOC131060387 isoform X1 [Cryptomeria japonica]
MDVLNIDWKNIDSRFVRDEFYENIRAPKWLDFLALEEPVDDDAWFCKPDCNHPRTAASLLDAPLFESPKQVKQPRPVRSTSATSISSTTPLGDRTASTRNCKKTGGPLSTSVTSLYELKTKENASRNLKKPSPADRNKHASRTGKYLADAENDNPNRPRSVSSVSSMGKNPKSSTPSNVGKSAKLQGSKNVSISPAKLSKQYTAAKDSQSPLSMEKKGVAKQAIGNLSTSSNTTPVTTPASSEKKGTKKKIVYNTTTPVKTPESSEKKGIRSPESSEKKGVRSSTGITKLTSNKTPTSDNQSSSLKSGSAIKGTFSAGNLFGKTPRKDFLTHLAEFCSEVKKLALYGGQKDSAKQSNMAFNHDSNVGSEEEGKQNQDEKINFSYERSSLSGSKDQQVIKNRIIDDPDKCSKSGPMEIGRLRLRNNKKDAAKSCPSSKQPKLNEEDFSSHTKNIVSDTSGNMVTNLSTLHEHERDDSEKVENIKDSSDPFLELFSGPIHAHEQENTAHSVDPQLEKYKESSEHLEKGFMEPHKKSFHAKIFSPSSWKKKRTDGVEQRVHPANKYSWNAGQKVQSCPPSPQQVCRLSQTSSSSSQGRKSTTTPMQPFRFRTSERGALREYRKLQRSSSCADNVVASPEPKLYMPDMFWFLKRCA